MCFRPLFVVSIQLTNRWSNKIFRLPQDETARTGGHISSAEICAPLTPILVILIEQNDSYLTIALLILLLRKTFSFNMTRMKHVSTTTFKLR